MTDERRPLDDDQLVERLQQELLPFRHEPAPLDLDGLPPQDGAGGGALARLVPWALAASLLLAAWAAVGDLGPASGADGSFPLLALAGAPTVDGGQTVDALAVGARLVTDPQARARLVVGSAGTVDVEPGSDLLAQAHDDSGWQFHLARGELVASIFAAPGRFRVGTPAGLAVDLGCAYRLRVEDDGRTVLGVTGGMVSFTGKARTIWVPEGATAEAWPDGFVGTPVWIDRGEGFAGAVAEIDRWGRSPEPAAMSSDQSELLTKVLGPGSRRDTLTPFHLLDHPWWAVREVAYERLAAIDPPPAHLSRKRILGGPGKERETWRSYLEFSW
jgi:hypothetical protein